MLNNKIIILLSFLIIFSCKKKPKKEVESRSESIKHSYTSPQKTGTFTLEMPNKDNKSISLNNNDSQNTSLTLQSKFSFIAIPIFVNPISGAEELNCIGVLINNDTVLTTATCAQQKNKNYVLQKVLIGNDPFETNQNKDESIYTEIDSASIHINPNFNNDTLEYNTAYIKLKLTVEEGLRMFQFPIDSIRPVNFTTFSQINKYLSSKNDFHTVSIELNNTTKQPSIYTYSFKNHQNCSELGLNDSNDLICSEDIKNKNCANFYESPIFLIDNNFQAHLIGFRFNNQVNCEDNNIVIYNNLTHGFNEEKSQLDWLRSELCPQKHSRDSNLLCDIK